MRWPYSFLRAAVFLTLVMALPLLAQQLDEQLLDDAPPAKASAAKTPTAPKSEPVASPASRPASKPASDQPLDLRHPLTPIAGKMELVERRLTGGLNSSIVGMQREILADLEKLLAPCECQSVGSEKPGNPKQAPLKQDQKQTDAKQTSGKKPGDGSKSPTGSGTGEGDNKPQQASPRELMEATWGNLPARERERVFEAAGESFLPKYAPTIRQYFERLAEEDAGK